MICKLAPIQKNVRKFFSPPDLCVCNSPSIESAVLVPAYLSCLSEVLICYYELCLHDLFVLVLFVCLYQRPNLFSFALAFFFSAPLPLTPDSVLGLSCCPDCIVYYFAHFSHTHTHFSQLRCYMYTYVCIYMYIYTYVYALICLSLYAFMYLFPCGLIF